MSKYVECDNEYTYDKNCGYNHLPNTKYIHLHF